MAKPKVLGIVLAGGEGKRLMPLTLDRAKPAVPFGGTYRLIDFALSNLVNAGYLRICVLTQYKSHSLDRHISVTWRMSTMLGNYVTPVPAQQRLGKQWFLGSADAIFQSMNLIVDERPDIIVVFGADHVYRMDAAQMVESHIESGATVTVAGIRVPRSEASAFGVIKTAEDGIRIEEFLEKPADPPGLVDSPDESFASMGDYVFTTDALVEALARDADTADSRHDMGGDIIPMLVGMGEAGVYDFRPTMCLGRRRRTATTGAMWEPLPRTTKHIWTWCPSSRSSTSTTRSGPSSPIIFNNPVPSSWRTPRPTTRSCAPGRSSRVRRSAPR